MDKKKSVAERLAVINGHALRREILQAAQEAHAQGRLVSPVGLSRQLKRPLNKVSYHFKVLREEKALNLLETIPRRGANEHLYGIEEDLLAEVQDSVALDQIAELIDTRNIPTQSANEGRIAQIVRATGRPVEA